MVNYVKLLTGILIFCIFAIYSFTRFFVLIPIRRYLKREGEIYIASFLDRGYLSLLSVNTRGTYSDFLTL